MNFQEHLTKSLNYAPTLSAQELSDQITEQAFNSSSLLQNVGMQIADNPSYRNVFVTHPSISEVTEGQVIPTSTVQSYVTTAADFTKIASSIELSNEVLTFSKFDIEANTAMLVGTVTADKIAELVVTDLKTRETLTPDRAVGEDILKVKSGFANEWGSDAAGIYALLGDVVKTIPDVYDADSKLFCNKENLVDFTTALTNNGDQTWLVQNGLLFGRYEIVVCDQLPTGTMYFGDLEAAFDVVALQGNQIADPYTKPDVLKITNTSKFATVAKDAIGITAVVQEV